MAEQPTQSEVQILRALALMCEQYLSHGADEMDHACMSAGEEALAVLAKYGFVDQGGRGGSWTQAGRELLDQPLEE